jgi:ParB/RepB/Spo0J family partition protein
MELRRVAPRTLDLSLGRLRQIAEGAVADKVRSLSSKGQLSPLVCAEQEDGRLVLVDGFVRQRAAARLGLDTVLVEVVQLSAVQMKAQVYLRNRERGLELLEECRLVRELHDADGLDQVDIAALLERHKSWVCRRLALLRGLSPNLACDLSLGLLGTGSLRRLAQLPARNQEELWAVARRDDLGGRDTAALVDLWRRTPDAEARRYLLDQPRAALALARGQAAAPADPRLGEAARALRAALGAMAQTALRARRRVDEGLGAVGPEGLAVLGEACREAATACASTVAAVERWLSAQGGTDGR